MKIEENIKEIVKEYNKGTHSIDALLTMKDRLAGYRVFLAEKIAEAYECKNIAEYAYKSFVSEEYMKLEGSIEDRKKMSENAGKSAREDFINWENVYKKMSLLYDATGDVLSAMTQRISHLKKEANESYT